MTRRRQRSRWSAALAACAGVWIATSTAAEAPPSPGGDPVSGVYLVAARQKPRIAESLKRGGVRLVEDLLESPLMLRVTVGNEKGFRSCGTRNNVKYALHLDGVKILEFADEGWTGSCEPNVFDAMSAQLGQKLAESAGAGTR